MVALREAVGTPEHTILYVRSSFWGIETVSTEPNIAKDKTDGILYRRKEHGSTIEN